MTPSLFVSYFLECITDYLTQIIEFFEWCHKTRHSPPPLDLSEVSRAKPSCIMNHNVGIEFQLMINYVMKNSHMNYLHHCRRQSRFHLLRIQWTITQIPEIWSDFILNNSILQISVWNHQSSSHETISTIVITISNNKSSAKLHWLLDLAML